VAAGQIDIVNVPVTPEAQNASAERVHEFGASLLLEAKLCATTDRSGLVLQKHIYEALEKLQVKRQVSPVRELRMAFGGAFFGAFVQGFITELGAKEPNEVLIAIYTILGLFGMFIVLWDLRR
jgi:hypothetical protein